MSVSAGTIVADRYELVETLAPRPACQRYRALDRQVAAEVELWLFGPELMAGENRHSQLMGAAVEMSGLVHPHLTRVLDCGSTAGSVYVTVQPGSPARPPVGLASPTDRDALVTYAASLANALEAVHAAGQVHSRLSPEDVVRAEGMIKLSGAGLYADLEPHAAEQAWGPLVRYWAPEVQHYGLATPASDVYSLAVILAEHILGQSLAPSALCERLAIDHPELYDVLGAALAVAPYERTASPQALASALRVALAGTAVTPMALPRPGQDRGVGTVDRGRAEDGACSPAGASAPAPASEGSEDNAPTMLDDRLPPEVLAVLDAAASAGRQQAIDRTFPGMPAGLGPHDPADAGSVTWPPSVPPARAATPAQPAMPDSPPAAPAPPAMPDSPPPARVPILERPGMRPRIRPVQSPPGGSSAAADLGRYAPPAGRARLSAGRILGYAGAGLGAAAASLIVIVIAGGIGASSSPARRSPDAGAAAASSPAGSAGAQSEEGGTPPPSADVPRTCPAGTIEMTRDVGGPYCIDAHEAPGVGQMPLVGMTLQDAEEACQRRGARLCEAAEWEAACRGKLGATWPYGFEYVSGACNLAPGAQGRIAPAGSLERCQSAVGAFDMSGNVAEWAAGGVIRGGSARDGSEGRCSHMRKREGAQQGYPDVGFRCCAEPR